MQRARVLVVDDKESVLEVMTSILEDAYEVTTASDAQAALAILGAGVDVVLTDVRMPGASGFELLAEIRRRAAGTRVVLMTGFASIPDAVAAMRQGAFDYVAKPLEAEEVRLVVARALQHDALDAGGAAPARAAVTDFREALVAARDQASRGYLVDLMREFQGNVTRAAMHARMTRENLHRLLKKYGVRSEAFKPPSPG